MAVAGGVGKGFDQGLPKVDLTFLGGRMSDE